MNERNRNWFTRYHVFAYVVAFLLILATASTAQVPRVFPTPTPAPQPTEEPTAQPTLTPPPSVSPTATPSDPIPTEIPVPRKTSEPKESIVPDLSPTPGPGDEGYDELPPGLDRPAIKVPVIARTRPRNTSKLIELLEPLTEYGLSLDQVLVEGMGRFPVAGHTYYFDDWLNPRYTPYPHLHHGLDMFADFGTPIRAPDRGVITALSDRPQGGGIGTWMRGSDGTRYYFAHQLERVEGIHVGQRVDVGTVIGFVGDTGNASGGTPHLHFEIHRGGALPPKPTVDRWLDEAEELAQKWVDARKQEIESKRSLLGGAGPGSKRARGDFEASMLLTLLDPIGGSVGLLPRLELVPSPRSRVSNGLLLELVRLRLDGYLFVPSSQGFHLGD